MQSPSAEIRLPSDRGGVPLHMRRTRSQTGHFLFLVLCSVKIMMDFVNDLRSISWGRRNHRSCFEFRHRDGEAVLNNPFVGLTVPSQPRSGFPNQACPRWDSVNTRGGIVVLKSDTPQHPQTTFCQLIIFASHGTKNGIPWYGIES